MKIVSVAIHEIPDVLTNEKSISEEFLSLADGYRIEIDEPNSAYALYIHGDYLSRISFLYKQYLVYYDVDTTLEEAIRKLVMIIDEIFLEHHTLIYRVYAHEDEVSRRIIFSYSENKEHHARNNK